MPWNMTPPIEGISETRLQNLREVITANQLVAMDSF